MSCWLAATKVHHRGHPHPQSYSAAILARKATLRPAGAATTQCSGLFLSVTLSVARGRAAGEEGDVTAMERQCSGAAAGHCHRVPRAPEQHIPPVTTSQRSIRLRAAALRREKPRQRPACTLASPSAHKGEVETAAPREGFGVAPRGFAFGRQAAGAGVVPPLRPQTRLPRWAPLVAECTALDLRARPRQSPACAATSKRAASASTRSQWPPIVSTFGSTTLPGRWRSNPVPPSFSQCNPLEAAERAPDLLRPDADPKGQGDGLLGPLHELGVRRGHRHSGRSDDACKQWET